MKAFKVLGNEANFRNTATRRLLECIKGRKLGEGKGKKGLIWETYRWDKHNFQQKIAKNTSLKVQIVDWDNEKKEIVSHGRAGI